MNYPGYLRGAITSILVAILFVLHPAPTVSRQSGEVTASWSLVGDEVVITYQLNAPRAKTYDVSVVLRRENDQSFAVVPRAVSGDVGTGKFASGVRQIRWKYQKDVPEGLTGSDYWFEITAREVIEEGGSNWWIYAAGGAAVVAGTIVLLGGGGDTSPAGNGGSPQPATLPGPPSVRPTP
ncbi:MAG: hypothetical protein OEM41_04865 [Ignavibacteria bacterium]|nr:hypothetical protein [Ignavibacteria bacterium]